MPAYSAGSCLAVVRRPRVASAALVSLSPGSIEKRPTTGWFRSVTAIAHFKSLAVTVFSGNAKRLPGSVTLNSVLVITIPSYVTLNLSHAISAPDHAIVISDMATIIPAHVTNAPDNVTVISGNVMAGPGSSLVIPINAILRPVRVPAVSGCITSVPVNSSFVTGVAYGVPDRVTGLVYGNL